MRKNKFIFMALIFLVSLLCISAVSAADDAASDVIADTDTNDVAVLEESIDDAALADSQNEENVLTEDSVQSKTFTDLKDTIDSSENEIELESDYKYDDQDNLVDGITINHNLTINGNGHTIDGNGKARIFQVPSSAVVTFNNITFINAFTLYDGYGGAIWADSEDTVKAINCNFINNNAGYGGAVTRVDCENCVFIKNNAYHEGGAAYYGNVNNCIFLSNSANYQTSKDIFYTGNESCIFADNATLNVSDFSTVFNSSQKQMITLTGDGGDVLNNVPVTIKITKDGEEIGTYSGLSGDGWTVDLGPGNYIATFSVDGNVEDATSKIRVTSGTSFEDLDYLINKKYSENSTIYLDADYAYEGDSVFGGIGISRDLTIDGNGHTINGSNLARIFSVTNNAVVTFYNITFVNGFAPENNFGGAIWECDGSTAKAIHCIFRENTASYYGGAVAGVDCEHCDFFFNKAENYDYARGGAIYNAAAVNCTFLGNEAIGEGGAIYIGSAIDSEFIGNKASSGGAIIYANATNCYFENNNAGSGGAICSGNATDCIFKENSANYGGAITYGEAINSTFTGNSAYNGGAIDFGSAVDCSFNKNSATKYGGAIHQSNATNCNFTENSASDRGIGGAVADGNIVNCNFTDNHATYNGGAVSDGNVINSTFTGNYADNDGGAMYRGTAQNCIFTNNHADHNGGAISNGDATDSTFTNNSANSEGGAICGYRDSDEYSSAVNCTFDNNVANANGGALAYADATNCTFTGNNVTNGHGTAMYGAEGHPCQAVNCIFTDNNGEKEVIENGLADSCTFNGDTPGETVVIANPVIKDFNFISTYNDGSVLVVNVTTANGVPLHDVKIKVDVYTTTGTFVGTYNITSDGWKVPLNGGNYKVTYNATDYDNVAAEGLIVVNKENSTLKSSAVSTVYNNNKYLVITLRDSKGNVISGAKVTVTLASAKAYTTDKNGQIKINVAKLVPKTYTAKISLSSTNYIASAITAKVTVKKATPKLTAKKKTFKVKVKTKKYKVTLKNNKGKVLKKVKLTLRVNKKTFKATTNSKGVATFKITNLKKKGKFTATVKFAGSKYYKALSKKVKITVKK